MQRSWHRPSVKNPTSYAHHVARYCKLAWTLLWERSDLLESQMIKRILKSQVNGDLFNLTQKYWQVLLVRNNLHLEVYLYAVAWILPTAPLPRHLHSQLHLLDVAQLPSQKVEIGAKSWEQQQSKQSDQVQDHSEPLTPTKQPACLLIKRVTEIMFFAYGLTETCKSEPKRLTIPHNSQLCWGLFVSNHLQKNMSFWIISYEQRIMQGIWMLESWSQVAIMKCSRYQFCNLRRTSLPTLLSFDHSCQEKPWFLNQHLAQRILKRWRLQSVIWCHVLVPPADVFWCPSQGRHINTSKQAAEWMNPYRCQQK